MEDFLGTGPAPADNTSHVEEEARGPTSEEVKQECDLWRSALLNQSAPYLSEKHTASDVAQLTEVMHELRWLDVADYQGMQSHCTSGRTLSLADTYSTRCRACKTASHPFIDPPGNMQGLVAVHCL